ncbi:helix-turn-helix domain-containing protein [Pseudonocardia sp. HH130630-07]|uniref:helix-turn-helix domain-containing protein n=1 Tax=Pseudonocardia sp. HH130630-07 TaxID=1690815 RepID=UPI000814DFE5|nr:helix-turn-helix transcriptional regulator [Pseudonocardia sp. HH130630-07]ANY08471.1 XRE family transcriptional regulator [Pseudonocardia sp. HH130630-07]
MTDPTVDATRELAAFLRRRRAELDPQDLGLPLRRRARRTPGLRREEVAELAGVSTDYVVRLEQARGLQPSADVVEALARALRLTPGERSYLFGLARQRPRAVDKPATAAAPALAQLVDDLSPRPVMLLNHRFDVLAWTAAMAALMVDFGTLPPEQRNAVRLCLLHPGVRATHADRERVVRDGIAHLRAAWAAHPDDPRLGELIAECRAADPDVERWWSAQDVDLGGRGRKVLRHPELGEITTDFEVLRPLADTDQVLVVHRGADDASRAALDRLAA